MSAIISARQTSTLKERFRDAASVAFIALLLGIPMIALTTVDQGASLVVQTRFGWLAVFVAAVFCGRLALRWTADRQQARRIAKVSAGAKPSGRGAKILQLTGWLILGFALFIPIIFSGNRYVVDIAITVLIYVMLGWGLNVVVGLAGLLNLGYAAFYAVGAYTYALLATQLGWSFWAALPVAGAVAAMFGMLLGYPILRLRGDYIAIVTLGFGEIIRVVLLNWSEFSGGPNGISSIPRPSFFGLPFERGDGSFASFFGLQFSSMHRMYFLYYLALALALLTHIFISRMRRLPTGRAWEALREDEIACKAMGMNTTNIKLSAFALGAMIGGFAGVFFAARQGFISPESFTFSESAIILAIVVLGGMGSQMGVVLAAIVLVTLPELGRHMSGLNQYLPALLQPYLPERGLNFSEYRMLLFGAAMVIIMVWKPGGLLSSREPTLTLATLRKREAKA